MRADCSRRGVGKQNRSGIVSAVLVPACSAADRMAEIEARWHHLPGGFLSERKLIKTHIQAVAESTQVATIEEVCWLAIAAATAWLPQREPAETALP